MSHYTHLTIEEREKARVMLEQGFNSRAIALELKRSPSTIYREFQRNSYKNGEYAAHRAQKLYTKRKRNCGPKHILEDSDIYDYVIERLELRWTPEQIAGRVKEVDKKPFSFSYNTIYRAIDSGVLPKRLRKTMRFKSKNKKRKPSDKRGKIADTINISQRPAGATNRTRYGHWESDTVFGKRKTGCIGTHVERKSGYLVAFHLENLQDNSFSKATVKAFESIPSKLKKTFTVDNGKEFMEHQQLSADIGMKIFFCDPYSPWQRGTNENTNGLLRQFFPKGSPFTDIGSGSLQKAVDLINNRPRKRFNFKTPSEVLAKKICCT